MKFKVNKKILKPLMQIDFSNVYWILVGSCTGKTTVSTKISDLIDIERVDMDAKIYGEFPLFIIQRNTQ